MAEAMKDSVIEWCKEIPTSWETKPNKYIMSKRKDICSHYSGEVILSLTMQGVIVRDLDAGGKMPTSFDGYQKVYPGNLLMCLFDYDVTPRCIGLISNKGLTSPAYSQFVLKDNNCARYYYYYYLMIDNTKELLHLTKNLRHSFTEEQIGIIKVPVPPVAEQEKIADFLDEKCAEIDKLSEDIQKQIDILNNYKKSVITRAVTKGLNLGVEMKDSGDERLDMIPANWDAKKLKFVTREIYENGLMVPENDKYIGMENVLSYSNDFHETNTEYEISFQKKCKKGVVLFGKLRPYLAKVIICPFTGFATGEFMQLSNFDGDSRYLRYSLLNRTFIEFVNMSTYGAKMPRANSEYINNLKICIPPKDEQCKIADFLDNVCQKIDESIRLQQKQLSHLDTYKRSIIYEYVTGKKRVKGAL